MPGPQPLRRHGITVATFGVALLPCIIAGEQGVPTSFLLLSAAIIVMSWRTGAISGLVAAFVGILSSAAFLIVPLRTLGAIRPILAAQAGVLTLLIVSVKRLRSRVSREEGLVHAISLLTFHAMSSRQQPDAPQPDGSLHHSLVQSSPDSVIVVDPYGFVVMVNGWAAKLHGYASPDQMVGLRVAELFTEDSRLCVLEDKRKTLDEGGVWNAEYEVVRRDGTSFPVEVNTAVIRDESGRPEALVMVERDITRTSVALS